MGVLLTPRAFQGTSKLYKMNILAGQLVWVMRDAAGAHDISYCPSLSDSNHRPSPPPFHTPSSPPRQPSIDQQQLIPSCSTLWWGRLEPWMDEDYTKQVGSHSRRMRCPGWRARRSSYELVMSAAAAAVSSSPRMASAALLVRAGGVGGGGSVQ